MLQIDLDVYATEIDAEHAAAEAAVGLDLEYSVSLAPATGAVISAKSLDMGTLLIFGARVYGCSTSEVEDLVTEHVC